MGYKEEVASRLYRAFDEMRAAASAHRRTFGQKELAEGIAEIIGGEPTTQSVVSRWMAKTEPSLPDNPTLEAAAKVLGVNELWLVFGKGPMRGDEGEGEEPARSVAENPPPQNGGGHTPAKPSRRLGSRYIPKSSEVEEKKRRPGSRAAVG